MSFLHEEYGTDAEIYRKALGAEVIADSSDPRAHKILAACGFVENSVPPIYAWHQLPDGLADEEERSRATRAVCLLRAAGFDANLDESLISEAAHAAVLTEIQQHRTEISNAATASSPAATAAPPAGADPAAPTSAFTTAAPTRRHNR